MEIKRLLQIGFILAGSIAAPSWALIINEDEAYDWAVNVHEHLVYKLAIPGTDSNGVFAFEPESYQPSITLMKNAMLSAYFDGLDVVDQNVFDSGHPGGGVSPTNGGLTKNHVYDVPEPGVLGLLGIGLIGVVLSRRRS